jgi:hypothetical protein
LRSERLKKVTFTRYAQEKFQFLKGYGFEITEASIREAVLNPSRVERKDDQLLALKPLDREYAVRVAYRIVNDNIVVVTFYPVKRERFNV